MSIQLRQEPDGLRHMVNLGLMLEVELKAAGIKNGDALRKFGAAAAFKRLKSRAPGLGCLIILKLHGAILETHWRNIDDATKKRLFKQAGIAGYQRDSFGFPPNHY